jgi:hypothetical protein
MSPIEPWLLEILACPRCHAKLRSVPDPEGFGCESCRCFYPVEDGIPQLLAEAASAWDPSKPDSPGR